MASKKLNRVSDYKKLSHYSVHKIIREYCACVKRFERGLCLSENERNSKNTTDNCKGGVKRVTSTEIHNLLHSYGYNTCPLNYRYLYTNHQCPCDELTVSSKPLSSCATKFATSQDKNCEYCQKRKSINYDVLEVVDTSTHGMKRNYSKSITCIKSIESYLDDLCDIQTTSTASSQVSKRNICHTQFRSRPECKISVKQNPSDLEKNPLKCKTKSSVNTHQLRKSEFVDQKKISENRLISETLHSAIKMKPERSFTNLFPFFSKMRILYYNQTRGYAQKIPGSSRINKTNAHIKYLVRNSSSQMSSYERFIDASRWFSSKATVVQNIKKYMDKRQNSSTANKKSDLKKVFARPFRKTNAKACKPKERNNTSNNYLSSLIGSVLCSKLLMQEMKCLPASKNINLNFRNIEDKSSPDNSNKCHSETHEGNAFDVAKVNLNNHESSQYTALDSRKSLQKLGKSTKMKREINDDFLIKRNDNLNTSAKNNKSRQPKKMSSASTLLQKDSQNRTVNANNSPFEQFKRLFIKNRQLVEDKSNNEPNKITANTKLKDFIKDKNTLTNKTLKQNTPETEIGNTNEPTLQPPRKKTRFRHYVHRYKPIKKSNYINFLKECPSRKISPKKVQIKSNPVNTFVKDSSLHSTWPNDYRPEGIHDANSVQKYLYKVKSPYKTEQMFIKKPISNESTFQFVNTVKPNRPMQTAKNSQDSDWKEAKFKSYPRYYRKYVFGQSRKTRIKLVSQNPNKQKKQLNHTDYYNYFVSKSATSKNFDDHGSKVGTLNRHSQSFSYKKEQQNEGIMNTKKPHTDNPGEQNLTNFIQGLKYNNSLSSNNFQPSVKHSISNSAVQRKREDKVIKYKSSTQLPAQQELPDSYRQFLKKARKRQQEKKAKEKLNVIEERKPIPDQNTYINYFTKEFNTTDISMENYYDDYTNKYTNFNMKSSNPKSTLKLTSRKGTPRTDAGYQENLVLNHFIRKHNSFDSKPPKSGQDAFHERMRSNMKYNNTLKANEKKYQPQNENDSLSAFQRVSTQNLTKKQIESLPISSNTNLGTEKFSNSHLHKNEREQISNFSINVNTVDANLPTAAGRWYSDISQSKESMGSVSYTPTFFKQDTYTNL